MADTLNIYGVTYSGVTGIKATDSNNNVLTYVRPTGTKSITENGTGIDVAQYQYADVNVSGGTPTLETITKTYTPTESQQTEQITAGSGYDAIEEVDVTVNAIPSQYIIPTGTKSISSNGTGIDVKAYEYADVAVPNSYSASDEGKVVDNGALVAQTAHSDVTPTASDQTIDTTTNNSIKVKGDADLVATNIKKDVEIFGVTGSYEGGGGGYGGSFTPASREFTYTFYSPGCTYLCCGSITRPDMTTGKGFVYSFFCTAGRYDCARSTNSGTSAAGEAYSTTNPTVSYSNDTFTLTWINADITKIPQPGTEYVWKAW